MQPFIRKNCLYKKSVVYKKVLRLIFNPCSNSQFFEIRKGVKTMKKITAILMSLMMLLALASCNDEKESTSSMDDTSSAISEASSEVPSETPSETIDPNAPLTADEIAAISEQYRIFCLADVFDQSYKTTETENDGGTSTTTVTETHDIANFTEGAVEIRSDQAYSAFGVSVTETYYYKDGKLYTIYDDGLSREGYWISVSEEEMAAPDTSDYITDFPITDELIADAEITRSEDGNITVSYEGDDETLFKLVSQVFSIAAYFDEYEEPMEGIAVHFTDKYTYFTITVDKDMRIKEVDYRVTFTETWEVEGEESGSFSWQMDILDEVTVYGYREGDSVTVPVPEDLEDFEKLDFGEDL